MSMTIHSEPIITRANLAWDDVLRRSEVRYATIMVLSFAASVPALSWTPIAYGSIWVVALILIHLSGRCTQREITAVGDIARAELDALCEEECGA